MFESCASGIDYECPEFHRATIVKARKEHICCECGEIINPGQKYEYVVGKYDGAIFQCHTCIVCMRIRNGLFRKGYLYGGLSEMLFECYDIDFFTSPPDWDDDDDERETNHIRWTRNKLGLPPLPTCEKPEAADD